MVRAHSTDDARTTPSETKLLTTILYSACSFFLLNSHIARLRESANDFGWDPPEKHDIEAQIYHAVLGKAHLTLRLRVTMTRTRNIDVEISETTAPVNLLGPLSKQSSSPIGVKFGFASENSVPTNWRLVLDTQSTPTNELLPLIQNKTTSRDHYLLPLQRTHTSLSRREEVLLYNEVGHVTEGTISNVLLLRDGAWVTPSIMCGLLNGLMRQHLLSLGLISEKVVAVGELKDGERVLLCNAVRGVFSAVLEVGHKR